ncbi:hypothetical protein KP509_24G022900 [Ceratopteris richardii]|nr:hypothetical protein KP509_24G022900 [Ceratopteris richardii]
MSALEAIREKAHKNGVTDLRFMSDTQVFSTEPNLNCVKALWSPSTGIIDSHTYMMCLQADAELHGATFAFNSSVLEGNVSSEGIEMLVCSSEPSTVHDQADENSIILCAKTVINSAGLHATSLARRLRGFPATFVPKSYFARGCYFSLVGLKPPFSHLVYPIPEKGGLGVHVTLDLSGQIRFGPDVEWLDLDSDAIYEHEFDFSVDSKRAEKFYPEIRKYYPALPDGSLKADYSGIRPKLAGPLDPPADFVIQGQRDHGISSLVNLFGIESPGLTASLAIADRVCTMLCEGK